jgi:elongation factor 1-alpha
MLDDKNIAICGHVKHGKSTFTGRLLVEMGAVRQHELKRAWDVISARTEFKENPKDYNVFQALTLLKRQPTFGPSGMPDDQSRTAFPERSRVRTAQGTYILIDNPGHDHYVDNTVYGIYLADFAILIVSASEGVGEGTERVARILEGLNIPLLAVCISKMDLVGYAEAKFNEIRTEVEDRILNRYFHRRNRLPIIPVSALTGFGFRSGTGEHRAEEPLGWYHGRGIGDLLSRAEKDDEDLPAKPLRITVEGRREVHVKADVGTMLVGSIESGTVKPGDVLALAPAPRNGPRTVRVRTVQRIGTLTDGRSEPLPSLSARSLVALTVSTPEAKALRQNLTRGTVFASADRPATVAHALRARVVFFDREVIYSAREFQLHVHGQKVPCNIANIDDVDVVYREATIKTFPGEIFQADINLGIPVSIEPSDQFPRLSHFVLRFEYRIVACGVCLDVRDTPFPRRLFRPDEMV